MESNKIELYAVFTVHKGNRKSRWKAISHPYFDNAYAIVRDYPCLTDGTLFIKEDEKHIVAGTHDISRVYQMAYDHT